jgi:hypothetical protein
MTFQAIQTRRGRAAGSRTRLRLRGWRGWLVLALAVGAIALRDSLGVLLGIMALLLFLDAAIPVPGELWSLADDRFRRLARRRASAERMRRLRGLAPERLDVLDDSAGWASTAPRRALGVEPIAIDSITGTVEDVKAAGFDRRFRPDWSCSGRWQHMWVVHAKGEPLPPISVYRFGGSFILRDGHHRVSVARDHGLSEIEAEVVELHRRG